MVEGGKVRRQFNEQRWKQDQEPEGSVGRSMAPGKMYGAFVVVDHLRPFRFSGETMPIMTGIIIIIINVVAECQMELCCAQSARKVGRLQIV